MYRSRFKNLLVLSLSLGLLSGFAIQKSWSDVVVENLKTPLTATLEKALNIEKGTEAGDTFIAVTQEDYFYQTSLLPAGSRMVGTVEKVRKSKRLGRPGYLQLRINQVEFPDGSTFIMPEKIRAKNKKNTKSKKMKKVKAQRLYHPKAKTKGGMMKSNMAAMIAGSTTTIALTSVGTFSSPYALGARIITGAVWEGIKGDKEKPLYKRMGKGGWRGSGVPGIYHFVKKEPNPTFDAQSEIQLHITPQVYAELLEANKNPDVDWEKADFKRVTWDDYESIERYAKMTEQLQDVPEAILNVEARPQKNLTFPRNKNQDHEPRYETFPKTFSEEGAYNSDATKEKSSASDENSFPVF